MNALSAWPKTAFSSGRWPRNNALLRLARQRLFGRADLRWLKSAAAQQGLLQIVRDCCNHSNAICSQCPFPDLVRSWEVHKKNVAV